MASNIHNNEPRNIAYSKDNEKYYSKNTSNYPESYLNSNGTTIFAGMQQTDLFLMCLGLAKYYGEDKRKIAKRAANIPINALGNYGKWLILGTGMVDRKDLNCLNDEAPLYADAEEYAEAGFDVLQNLLNEHGSGFDAYLEALLKKIVREKKDKELLDEE